MISRHGVAAGSVGVVMLLSCVSGVRAQTLFPGETGQSLLESLVTSYKPATVYSYARARDTLFASVLNTGDDSLRCVYTGYALHLDLELDPTIQGCNGDGDNNSSTCSGILNINTEHLWPRSKGADSGNALSDMHHLAPSRGDANSARSNNPFAEIADQVTDAWFCGSSYTESLPATGIIDSCSEVDYGADVFEPREDFKGDVARAMFYFYTMYRAEADAADVGFFGVQKDVLRAWHQSDPVDARESTRSQRIATYQGGKDNPFILDASLVDRAYFESLLPVEIAAFTALASGSDVLLRWTTASEVDNAGFEIQHDGGEGFGTLGFKAGAGTSRGPRFYEHTVTSLPAGLHRFRLRQFDFDGGSTYSRAVEAIVAPPDRPELKEAFPNPFRSVTNIRYELPGPSQVSLVLLDALGRQVRVLDTGLQSGGSHEVVVDADALPSGVYFVRIQADDFSDVMTLVSVR